MSGHHSMREETRRCIEEIRSIAGVVACALVSCEGLAISKYSQEDGLSSSLFAAMSATVLAAADTVCSSVHVQRPSVITITAIDATILIVSVGEVALIAAVIDKSADLPTVRRQLSDMAARIEEVA
ncbi:MAG: roadblock/LC7 domain-containing protein [Methanomicrobiales archaeon]|nr:roadblock/LC7 domain-containing protein [Methanomicrobiales archaeon]